MKFLFSYVISTLFLIIYFFLNILQVLRNTVLRYYAWEVFFCPENRRD